MPRLTAVQIGDIAQQQLKTQLEKEANPRGIPRKRIKRAGGASGGKPGEAPPQYHEADSRNVTELDLSARDLDEIDDLNYFTELM